MAPIRNSPTKEKEWIKPTEKHGPRWHGFLMSNVRNDESRRRKAQCTYCNKIFAHGKPHLLFAHLKDSCKNIPPDTRSAYLRDAMADAEDSNNIASKNQDDGRIISVSIPNKTPQETVAQHFRPISKEKTNHLHELLLKLLISSNIAFAFLENPYFQEFQSELARCVYKIPN
jgi:hypothetical protein